MSHRIITIEREYASGGREIGEMIAERLGIPCYNREILLLRLEFKNNQTKQKRNEFYRFLYNW